MPGFWRVTLVYGLALVLMEALLLAAGSVTPHSGAAAFFSGCLVTALLVPAFVAGFWFERLAGRGATSPEAWRYAAWFAAIQGVLMALLLWLAMQDLLAEDSDGAAIFGSVLVAYVTVALLISRFFFGFGTRQGRRTHIPR
ncbi:MAG: ABZJ_00895 family protein [Rhodobacteraceae bacterium]|nr:ABZJ_00895 family protein [Paracoccaceae bacterium]